jgi:uncharacterized protein
MRTQVIFIHGGTSFSSYEKFLNHLKTGPIWDPKGVEKKKRWKETIYEAFGNTCDVFFPSMPNSNNSKYEEWKIWFERYFEYLTGEVILIGHSQGGYFLAKYLSENTVSFHVKALYLVSTPFRPDDFHGEDGADFAFDPNKLKRIQDFVQNIIIIHSKDDEVVPVSHAEMFHVALPSAKYMLFNDRGHFLQSEFPEILEDIQEYV